MPVASKHEAVHSHEPSMISLISGWAQQGVRTFFASQRILLDLAVRQNANVMHILRQQLSDPHHSPTAIFGEVASEGLDNFLAGQKVLLDLGKQQNEILMTGVKERIGECPRRIAAVDLLRRSLDTFIDMQGQFLKLAGKQTHSWIDATKSGKPYQPEHLLDLARESMDTFVKTQKEFLDIVAEEASNATGGKRANAAKKTKKTDLSEVARQATDSLIDAQKKLVDVVGEQMNANVKTATRTLDLMQPLPFLPLGELTREAVRSYVDAQKSLMEVIARPNGHDRAAKAEGRMKRPARGARKAPAVATA
ncbi:MAG TPA: hypothetical protein VMI10_15590 [Terriglobales bacterium]|nr:hypothetical protein [Terriglobales bacterium]